MKRVNGIPILGFGTWPLSSDEARRAIATALEVGFRHVDTAQMYGNEAEVGGALAASGVKRKELFIVTKVAPGNLGRDSFMPSVEGSLAHLGGPVDLLLIHWPPGEGPFRSGGRTPVGGQGARPCQGDRGQQFHHRHDDACRQARPIAMLANQVEFHPLIDQAKLKEAATKLGIAISAYSPLGRGAVMKDPVIQAIARNTRPPSEVALAWITQQDVVAIPMTTKRENAASNLRALDLVLPEEDMAAISR